MKNHIFSLKISHFFLFVNHEWNEDMGEGCVYGLCNLKSLLFWMSQWFPSGRVTFGIYIICHSIKNVLERPRIWIYNTDISKRVFPPCWVQSILYIRSGCQGSHSAPISFFLWKVESKKMRANIRIWLWHPPTQHFSILCFHPFWGRNISKAWNWDRRMAYGEVAYRGRHTLEACCGKFRNRCQPPLPDCPSYSVFFKFN